MDQYPEVVTCCVYTSYLDDHKVGLCRLNQVDP
jgi:hypothetical protein